MTREENSPRLGLCSATMMCKTQLSNYAFLGMAKTAKKMCMFRGVTRVNSCTVTRGQKVYLSDRESSGSWDHYHVQF